MDRKNDSTHSICNHPGPYRKRRTKVLAKNYEGVLQSYALPHTWTYTEKTKKSEYGKNEVIGLNLHFRGRRIF